MFKSKRSKIALTEFLFIIVLLITIAISSSFPDYIKVQGAIDLMKALIDVDGILLGFAGIVYAQLLSSLMEQQNTIFEKMLSRLKDYSRYESFLKVYSNRKNALVMATIVTFALLLGSIITSLVSLARLSTYDPIKDTYAPFGLTLFPMFFLVEAVLAIVIALVGTPMEPPKRQEERSLEKSPETTSLDNHT